MTIFISHLHGDHLFGLPGLLHSMSFMGRTRELEIVGPKGVAQFINAINRVVKLYSEFPLHVRDVGSGIIVDEAEYIVRAAAAKHGVPCLAYAFEEKPRPGRFDPAKARRFGIPEGPLWKKLQTANFITFGKRRVRSSLVVGPRRRGVKITYAVDTRPCSSVARLAAGSDLLIHDSSFDESAAIKAKDYGHSTATEAAQIAKKSKVRKLALFHISAMYEDARPLLLQAKRVFRNTVLAEDMATIYVDR
jgi:ribonuclease Z